MLQSEQDLNGSFKLIEFISLKNLIFLNVIEGYSVNIVNILLLDIKVVRNVTLTSLWHLTDTSVTFTSNWHQYNAVRTQCARWGTSGTAVNASWNRCFSNLQLHSPGKKTSCTRWTTLMIGIHPEQLVFLGQENNHYASQANFHVVLNLNF